MMANEVGYLSEIVPKITQSKVDWYHLKIDVFILRSVVQISSQMSAQVVSTFLNLDKIWRGHFFTPIFFYAKKPILVGC